MTLRVITPPTEELVELELLKQQLELDATDRDDLVSHQLATATATLEAMCQRRFLAQALEWSICGWSQLGRLPLAPVAAAGVSAILYVDAEGVERTLSAAQYVVSPCGPTVAIRPARGVALPELDPDAAEPVRIRFTAGVDAADVPANVKTAAMMLVAHWFANREAATAGAVTPLPLGVEALIAPERW